MANHLARYRYVVSKASKRNTLYQGSRLRSRTGGFTYLGVMILVALIALLTTTSIQAGAFLQRRAAEEELLAIGMEFRSALISYANATPPGKPTAPPSLQDLLKDPRYPNPRRHLRKIYIDPMTGKEEWGTVALPDGTGIGGIYSLSNAVPIKVGNFSAPFESFEGRHSYHEWIFAATLVSAAASPSIPKH